MDSALDLSFLVAYVIMDRIIRPCKEKKGGCVTRRTRHARWHFSFIVVLVLFENEWEINGITSHIYIYI